MIKIFEAFAGYGGCSWAFKQANIPHEIVGFSEINSYAIKVYQDNHGGTNFGDIIKITPNDIPDFDLFSGGFPCQTFSSAGKRLGELDPRGTLFYEIIRICEIKKPKYILLENVKGLTSLKFKETFNKILSELDRIGYNVQYKILNSKDFGIPQSRARIWFVCIRKDIDYPFKFSWPNTEPLRLTIRDILEDVVDDKYYLSERAITGVVNRKPQLTNVRDTLKVGGDKKTIFDPFNNKYIISDICSTIRVNNSNGNAWIKDNKSQYSTSDSKPETTELSLSTDSFTPDKLRLRDMIGKYRRLTPKECFRLMGFLNDEMILNKISNTQQYKLAGNGWCLRPAKDILINLLKDEVKNLKLIEDNKKLRKESD